MVVPKSTASCGTSATCSRSERQGVAADVHAVEQHAAAGGLEEAGNEAGQRRLAGAGQADQRHHLARARHEADAVEDSAVGVVGEAHVIEAQLAGDRRRRRARRRGRRSPA